MSVDHILENVKNAMQDAEEMGGVNDTTEYIVLMNAIITEASTRIATAIENDH